MSEIRSALDLIDLMGPDADRGAYEWLLGVVQEILDDWDDEEDDESPTNTREDT